MRKKIKKPISMCSCCNLKYYTSGVCGGLTITLETKSDPDNFSAIDIPLKELPNLIAVAKKILKG